MSFQAKSFYGKSSYVPPHLRKRPVNINYQTDFDTSDVEDDTTEYDEVTDFQRSVEEGTVTDESEYEESDEESLTEDEVSTSYSTSDSGDADNIPLSSLARDPAKDVTKDGTIKGCAKVAAGQVRFRWRKRKPLVVDSKFLGDPLPPPPEKELTSLEYFKSFFDDDLINHLVEQTNLYSVQQTGNSVNVSKEEMERFIAVYIFAAVVWLPSMRMYWETGTRVPFIADLMSVNRFEKIRQFFHCNNNQMPTEKDKLFKVRPVIESVLEKCKRVPIEEFQAIDEQIIPTKGRSGLRQYLPKKPNKWGIKVWARCGASGIVHQFEIYTGKGSADNDDPLMLMGGNVVLRLLSEVPERQRYKIFFDNFFSSVPLMKRLKEKGYLAAATLRQDRMKGASKCMATEKVLKKKGRGSFDSVVEANSGITIVRWFDNKMVQLLSNYITDKAGNDARRWNKKTKEYITIKRPQMVEIYNAKMGGVDLCDMLLSCYRIRRRSNKYYFHIVYYLLGISITNGWLLYKRHELQRGQPKRQISSLVEFQLSIAKSLALSNKPMPTLKRGRPSLDRIENPSSKRGRKPATEEPTLDIRKDKVDHFPEYNEKQGRCKLCKKGYTFISCTKCKTMLCITKNRNCFKEYH